MPAPPAHAVDQAAATLRDDEVLLLLLPTGFPPAQRAAMLSNVSDLAQAIRARGVPVEVMRVSGPDLERRGVAAAGDLESAFILYIGEPPALPEVEH